MTRLQYCRYCRWCYTTEEPDVWRCTEKNIGVEKGRATKPNRCPNYEFFPMAADHPRLFYKPRPRSRYEQLHLTDEEDDI